MHTEIFKKISKIQNVPMVIIQSIQTFCGNYFVSQPIFQGLGPFPPQITLPCMSLHRMCHVPCMCSMHRLLPSSSCCPSSPLKFITRPDFTCILVQSALLAPQFLSPSCTKHTTGKPWSGAIFQCHMHLCSISCAPQTPPQRSGSLQLSP